MQNSGVNDSGNDLIKIFWILTNVGLASSPARILGPTTCHDDMVAKEIDLWVGDHIVSAV